MERRSRANKTDDVPAWRQASRVILPTVAPSSPALGTHARNQGLWKPYHARTFPSSSEENKTRGFANPFHGHGSRTMGDALV